MFTSVFVATLFHFTFQTLLINCTMVLNSLKVDYCLAQLFISCSFLLGALIFLFQVIYVPLLLHFVLLVLIIVFCGCVLSKSLCPAETTVVESVLGVAWGAFSINNVQSLKPLKIIAHRACGLDAPENTLSALKRVIKEGITAVEFDLMLTSDNVPIVFHDDTLDRLSNVSKAVVDLTFQELQGIDISVKHPFRNMYPEEKVPSLKDFVECCIENNVTMLMDIKDGRLAPALIDIFKEFPKLSEMALVSSFNPYVIYQIRTALPKVVGCLAWRPYYISYKQYSAINGPSGPRSKNPIIHRCHRLMDYLYSYALHNFVYYILGLSALLLHKEMITRDVIQFWKKRRVRVMAWTVNDPIEKDFFERFLQIPYLTDTLISS